MQIGQIVKLRSSHSYQKYSKLTYNNNQEIRISTYYSEARVLVSSYSKTHQQLDQLSFKHMKLRRLLRETIQEAIKPIQRSLSKFKSECKQSFVKIEKRLQQIENRLEESDKKFLKNQGSFLRLDGEINEVRKQQRKMTRNLHKTQENQTKINKSLNMSNKFRQKAIQRVLSNQKSQCQNNKRIQNIQEELSHIKRSSKRNQDENRNLKKRTQRNTSQKVQRIAIPSQFDEDQSPQYRRVITQSDENQDLPLSQIRPTVLFATRDKKNYRKFKGKKQR